MTWKCENWNDPWYVLTPISQLIVGQNKKSRTVLKSSGQADFKTDLTFWISWRFDEDIDKKQTWEFFCGHPVVMFIFSQFGNSRNSSLSHFVSLGLAVSHSTSSYSRYVNKMGSLFGKDSSVIFKIRKYHIPDFMP